MAKITKTVDNYVSYVYKGHYIRLSFNSYFLQNMPIK